MAHTPRTAALLRGIRREQGRPLRENGADIGIHRDRLDDDYADECDAQTPGNCGFEFLHTCTLTDEHSGRHMCECGRNWPDADNYVEPDGPTYGNVAW